MSAPPHRNGHTALNGASARASAVLFSGGLDSALLLAQAAEDCPRVQPLYVRCGLRWEAAELDHARRFLAAIDAPAIQPLEVLSCPVEGLYGDHWSVRGGSVPDADTPDEAVLLPGRNVLLLAHALLWCQLHGVPRLALGSLGNNPFPDASADFVEQYAALVNRGLDAHVHVERPLAHLGKADVLRLGRRWPLELTFSCLDPQGSLHCGRCNKCAERQRAFATAGLSDRTVYAAALAVAPSPSRHCGA